VRRACVVFTQLLISTSSQQQQQQQQQQQKEKETLGLFHLQADA
jgi:hypothetical protein